MDQKVINKMLSAFSDNATYITQDVCDARVFQHEVFGVKKRLTYAGSDTINIGLDATNVTCDKLIFLPFSADVKDTGPVTVDIYAGSTITDETGTEWVGGDRNTDGAVVPELKIYYNPTITADGTASALQDYILADKKSVIGGEVGDFPFVLTKGIKYVIRLTNTSISAGIGTIGFSWIESSDHLEDYVD